MPDTMAPLWLTVKQTAQLLQLSEDVVYPLTHRADFPAVRIGRAIRIDRRRLEEGANAHTGEAVTAHKEPAAGAADTGGGGADQ